MSTAERYLPSRDGENRAPFRYPVEGCAGRNSCRACPRWKCPTCTHWRPWCVGSSDTYDCNDCWALTAEATI